MTYIIYMSKDYQIFTITTDKTQSQGREEAQDPDMLVVRKRHQCVTKRECQLRLGKRNPPGRHSRFGVH